MDKEIEQMKVQYIQKEIHNKMVEAIDDKFISAKEKYVQNIADEF